MSYQGGILDFEPSVTTAGILVWRELNDRSCFLPQQGFKYHIQTKWFDNMQIPGNNYQPAQTFCWTGTGIFRENRGQADIVKPCNQAS